MTFWDFTGKLGQMTSHEFAHQLLSGPDLSIGLPKVTDYDDGDTALRDPFVQQMTAETFEDSGEEIQVLVISHR